MELIYGLCPLPWWGYIVVTLVFTQITILGVTLFLHRGQAHRALELHPLLAHIFRFWLWMSTGMVTKAWTAIHRKHHARCETPDDPHSPQMFGLLKVLWQGGELYRKEAKNKETLERYGKGTPDDWIERHLYTKYNTLGIQCMFVLDVLIFGLPGLAIWAIQMGWIPFFAAGVVNGLGHFWGYRNFECDDASTNLSPWGFIIGGEELHNNHHTYPTSAKFSIKSFEIDIGWGFIRLFKLFGLVNVKRIAPEALSIPGKVLDVETVRALVYNRYQVMSCYTKEVLLPIFFEEKQKAANPALGKDMKMALVRRPAFVEPSVLQRLIKVLDSHSTLKLAYQFRERLLAIWAETTVTHKELVEALQLWCKEAEASNIQALKEFAAYLRSYTLKTEVA